MFGFMDGFNFQMGMNAANNLCNTVFMTSYNSAIAKQNSIAQLNEWFDEFVDENFPEYVPLEVAHPYIREWYKRGVELNGKKIMKAWLDATRSKSEHWAFLQDPVENNNNKAWSVY